MRIQGWAGVIVVLAGLLGPSLSTVAAAQAPQGGASTERRVTTIKARRLESDRKQHIATYTGEVEAADSEMTVWADRMELVWDDKEEQILKITAIGNVRIRRTDGKHAASERAEYYKAEERLVLIGKAKAWQGEDTVSGSRITLYNRDDRTVVEGDGVEQVRSVFVQKRGAGGEAGGSAKGPSERALR